LRVASPLRVASEQPDGGVEFKNLRGAGTLTTNNPAIIAALRRLEEIWPHSESFEELVNTILPLVPDAEQIEAVEGLAQTILKLAGSTMADLRTLDPPLAAGICEKPTAGSLARVQAQEGGVLTTLLHTHLDIEDEQGKKFLQLLDGTRDRRALTEAMAAEFPNESRETIAAQVDGNLVNFYQMGLLEA
jgi:hypothetical protein